MWVFLLITTNWLFGVLSDGQMSTQKILVTAATGELGQSICEYLAASEHNLLIAGRNEEKLKKLQLVLTNKYPKVEVAKIIIDFNDLETIKTAVDGLKQEAIKGVVLITPRPSLQTKDIPTPEQWSKAFSEGFIAPLEVLRLFQARIIKDGSVVIISGLTSKFYMPTYPHTNVIRLAWSGELKSLAHLLGKRNIRVNAISPGIILTDYNKAKIKERGSKNTRTYDQQLAYETQHLPLYAYGTPLDVASLVGFLLSPDSKHLNGTNIPLDGGESNAY
jgi:Dehydrogenases with different specificities (related to short-chain alcohol dehydrogenases)